MSTESGSGRIRASNAERLDNELRASKKNKAHQVKRTFEQMLDAVTEDQPQPSESKAKQPKVTLADVKLSQRMHQGDKERSAAANKDLQSKLAIIRRYLNSEKIGPYIRENGDKAILAAKCTTVAEADVKLDHIHAICSSRGQGDNLVKAVCAGADAFERMTDQGRMIGMDLRGFAGTVFFNQDAYAWELEEMRCEWGSLFTAPWYVRFAGTMVALAYQTHLRNLKMGEPVASDWSPQSIAPDMPPPDVIGVADIPNKAKISKPRNKKGKGPETPEIKSEAL